ncbi:hypothetical protein JW823_01545 [bacterium]|nr:hypothetical protein [candidate division CSSED10-310 bacterium]
MPNVDIDATTLNGAWKLEYFETTAGDRLTHFSDILLISLPYYSDFHSEYGLIHRTFSHVGMIRLSGSSITFQVQLSTESSYIGLVAVGMIDSDIDRLEITMERGNTPGRWVYRRLN